MRLKPNMKIVLLLILSLYGNAQDTTIVFTPAMVTQQDYISLGDMEGWLFRQGNDTTWAYSTINYDGWQKLKPTKFTEKLADKNGKLEGWLRLKIKLDSSFENTPLDISSYTWAALDIYVDGKLMYTFGNSGANGKKITEYNPTNKIPLALNVEKGKDHLLAIHFVDFLSPLPPYNLKSDGRFAKLIFITLPGYKTSYLNENMNFVFYRTLWFSVNIILCFLFWLLRFQNRAEKNILLIAIMSTAGVLTIFFNQFVQSFALTYVPYRFAGILWPILASLLVILLLLFLVRVFKRKMTPLFTALLSIILLCPIIQIFYSGNGLLIFQGTLGILLYAYYIITSWKTLRGAQWAVLTGILLSFSFALPLIIYATIHPTPDTLGLLLFTGVLLSFPLSLLVYISMRFKEIIKEVRDNAKQVVQLSEEKREKALNQQKILQEEVNRQTAALRATMDNLKSTQDQLIQSLQHQASELEMQALRAQMNPHFIFNSLNSIKLYTVENNSLAASEYLIKFSRLIRLVLENSRKDRVELHSELESLRLYIEMEAMRFKEKLQYVIIENIDTSYIEIPPLLIQPYVENAVWHGLMHKETGGNINIVVDKGDTDDLLKITITDDGIGRAKAAELKSKSEVKQKSYGMKVTSERIALINQLYNTNTTVQIIDLVHNNGESAGTKVIIQIPV